MCSLKLFLRFIYGAKHSRLIKYDASDMFKKDLVLSPANIRTNQCKYAFSSSPNSKAFLWQSPSSVSKNDNLQVFKKYAMATATCNKQLYSLLSHGHGHTCNSTCFCHCSNKEHSIFNVPQHDRKCNSDCVYFSDSTEKKSKEYKENIYTIPNLLTMGRIGSTPILAYLITSHSYQWSLGLLVVAGITDVLDGQIARAFPSQKSALGTHLDPLADKLLVFVISACLTKVSLIPVWLFSIIVIRDLLLIIAVFYLRYTTLPPPKTFSRYWNINKVSVNLCPSSLSKFNTVLQISTISLSLAAPVFDFIQHPALQGLWYLTAITTLITGVQYAKDPWKYVKRLNKK